MDSPNRVRYPAPTRGGVGAVPGADLIAGLTALKKATKPKGNKKK